MLRPPLQPQTAQTPAARPQPPRSARPCTPSQRHPSDQPHDRRSRCRIQTALNTPVQKPMPKTPQKIDATMIPTPLRVR